MARPPTLYDHLGRPIERSLLAQEVAGPTTSGVRQIISGHPAAGITPQRLAGLLRAAEGGDPTGYLELAEDMEERDPHYQGVLGTRKRSVTQLDITVEAAGDDAAAQQHADLLRTWLDRDELEDELFDLLDAIGKGFSVTEIVWATSSKAWLPERLEWRDPRWFEPSPVDGRTMLLRTDPRDRLPAPSRAFALAGAGRAELPPGKFVVHIHKAKSGLPIRGGLARVACWAWMFKAFSLKDWVVFCEVYGQPLRLGKYGPGASAGDKETLLDAVANIASDCAAIIPDTMLVEFVTAQGAGGGGSGSTTLYKDLCDWLDQQVSKAVLGQTTTTDAISGGHAVAREHRLVQEDIERADAKLLAGTLNRQLVPLIIGFNFGPQTAYPRIRIGRAEPIDIAAESEALTKLVPLGLEVEMSVVRDRLGYPDPEPGSALLAAPVAQPAVVPAGTPGGVPSGGGDGDAPPEEAPDQDPAAAAASGRVCPSCGVAHGAIAPADRQDVIDELGGELEHAAAAASDGLVEMARALLAETGSLEQLGARLMQARQVAPPPPPALAELLGNALFISQLTGRAEIAAEAGDQAALERALNGRS